MTRHLSIADVLALTAAAMEADGWAAPVLRGGGEGRLESAVSRTQMAEQYDAADVIRQAVLLAVGIAEAQAFVDGNKRAALQAMLTFLYVNGVRVPLDDDGDALAGQILAIAERSDSLAAATDRFESWLRATVSLA